MIMMIDLDIPSSTQPTTFLHWIQTDMVADDTLSTILADSGAPNNQGFIIQQGKPTAAIVPYTQPNPPAQNPLSHRYAEILLDTSALTPAGLVALTTAAQGRVNFNIAAALKAAGLANSVVAFNFFNVTNPAGAAPPPTTGTATGTAGAKPSGTGAAKPVFQGGPGKKASDASKISKASKASKAVKAAKTLGASTVAGGGNNATAQSGGKGASGIKASNGTALASVGSGDQAPPESGKAGRNGTTKFSTPAKPTNVSAVYGNRQAMKAAAPSGRYSFCVEVLFGCVLGAVVVAF